MMRLLACTSPARGHLFPLTPILLRLRDRGHEIHLRTLSAEVERMRGLGFEVEPIDPVIEAIELNDYGLRSPLTAQRRAMDALGRRAAHDAADMRRAIEAASPDLVLADVLTSTAAAACRSAEAGSASRRRPDRRHAPRRHLPGHVDRLRPRDRNQRPHRKAQDGLHHRADR